MFGQPIQFSLNRKYLQKSTFGGLMTFSFILTFILIAFQGFQDLVNGKNVITYTQDIYNFIPPTIDFSSIRFNMAISFNDPRINDPRYFQLELFQGIQTIDETGKKLKNLNKEELEPCTEEHFLPELTESLLKKNKEISNFLCPRKNLTIRVEGAYSSPVFSYLSIKLSKCKNTTNLTCFSDEKIEEIFNELNQVYLDVYFTNNLIRTNDFNAPVISFLDDRIYVLIDRNSYKEKNFFFTQNKILTDSSVLTTDYKEEVNAYTYENIYDETIVKINDGEAKEVIYAGIFFRSNILGKKHTRTFEKIGKFFRYIGGFWSLLFLVFSLIAKKFNRYKLLVKMANSLYRFVDVEKKKLWEKSFFFKKYEAGSYNYNFEDEIQDFLTKEKGCKLVCDFKSFILGDTLSEFFNMNKQQTMRESALLTIQKDTDILHLLTKTKEIEKLKTVLFTKPQKSIFEYFSKPEIFSNNSTSHYSRSSLLFFHKKMSKTPKNSNFKHTKIFSEENSLDYPLLELKDLYKSFLQIKASENSQIFILNQSLLNSFDRELYKIFRNHSMIDKKNDETDKNPNESPFNFLKKIYFK